MNKKGFTILELIVSIGIFSVVCVSVLGLVNSTNKANNKSEDSIIATDLASEGIEVITYLRDNNFINNRNYTNGILNFDSTSILIFNRSSNAWSINFGNDNDSETINSCMTSNSNSCRVYKSVSSDYYTQARNNSNSDLIATNFYRLIDIQSNSGYITVKSTVAWKEKNMTKTVILEKNLWNWD